jgi:hypothetical protein
MRIPFPVLLVNGFQPIAADSIRERCGKTHLPAPMPGWEEFADGKWRERVK